MITSMNAASCHSAVTPVTVPVSVLHPRFDRTSHFMAMTYVFSTFLRLKDTPICHVIHEKQGVDRLVFVQKRFVHSVFSVDNVTYLRVC